MKELKIVIIYMFFVIGIVIGRASDVHKIDTLQTTIEEQEITIEEQKVTIEEQGAVLAEFKSEDIELRPCMLCKEQVELYPINNSFYIECPYCHLETGYYDSKAELIDYWNGGNY